MSCEPKQTATNRKVAVTNMRRLSCAHLACKVEEDRYKGNSRGFRGALLELAAMCGVPHDEVAREELHVLERLDFVVNVFTPFRSLEALQALGVGVDRIARATDVCRSAFVSLALRIGRGLWGALTLRSCRT
jgi:hypothetical protein